MQKNSVERFGKYVLLERIAAGGMAEVYLAKSTGAEGIGRFFAIKRILPQFSDNIEFIEMFKEEAKLAMNLHHGNVVQIFEFGIEKGQFYLVMEFVEGQNLRQILNHLMKIGKSLSVEQVLYICKEVAAGLDYAHRSLDKTTGKPLNIIHRDMSPQNAMVSFEGEVKIVDFGIAKAENQIEQTRAGTIKGKFGYMSPEQAEALPIDLRTDIFSLGIILWEMLTRERLFVSQSEAATLKKIRDCNIPSPRKLNPNVPAELEKIVMKALARDKGVRYQTAAALHKDLNRFMNTEYPEFSQQDFSVFMKSIYAETFMENRKKLSKYAQVPVPLMDEATAVSFTESMSMDSMEEKMNQTFSDIKEKVDLKGLQLKEDVESSIRRRSIQHQVDHQAKKSSSGTKTSQTSGSSQKTSGLLSVLIFVAAAFTGWFVFFSGKIQTGKTPRGKAPAVAPAEVPTSPAPPVEAVEQASSQKIPLNVQSFPQGAQVQIDGRVVGTTPYSGTIEANKIFRIVLNKEGYVPYEQVAEKAVPPSHSLRAALVPEPPTGFVSVDVRNASPNTVIRVNDIKLTESLPIRRLRIPAGVPVKIQIMEPYSGTVSEQTITVGQGQLRSVIFNLSKTAGPNN